MAVKLEELYSKLYPKYGVKLWLQRRNIQRRFYDPKICL